MEWDEVRGRLQGPGALVSSIFRDDYSLDAAAIERNVTEIVERGIGRDTGFIIAPCGDGEYVTLSPDEHRTVVETAVRASGGRIAVVAGVQSNDWRSAIAYATAARDAGAIAVMMAPPMYYPLTADATVDFYRRFADAVDIGIMVYEQAWRGPQVNAGVGPATLARLVEIPNIVAFKHSGLFNVAEEMAILDRFADRIAYMDTSAAFVTTTAHMHGAAGFVSECSTWWPEFELRYWELLEAGEYRRAELGHAHINPLFHYMTARGGAHTPVSVLKACLEYAGFAGGPIRPPHRALDSAEKTGVFEVLAAIGVPPAGSSPADRAAALERMYDGGNGRPSGEIADALELGEAVASTGAATWR
jgi:4-hydroxy-tetrahydrodipicolinate synthase